jgi:hypothetical protein
MFAHVHIYMTRYPSNIRNCAHNLYRNITLKQFETEIMNIENKFSTQYLGEEGDKDFPQQFSLSL